MAVTDEATAEIKSGLFDPKPKATPSMLAIFAVEVRGQLQLHR